MREYLKSGYLYDDFHLYHLKDHLDHSFEFHYHEFDKIIIFYSGNVIYQIEGKDYHLKPWDILFVSHHDIHKPIIDKNQTYDRIVLWIHRGYLTKFDSKDYSLSQCFDHINQRHYHLLRMNTVDKELISKLLFELEQSIPGKEFAGKLLTETMFLQLMIYINRIMIDETFIDSSTSIQSDQQIDMIIRYINDHLHYDLTIELLAQKFYLSKSFLMHKFKLQTGYSLHNYIEKKRLAKSYDLIKNNVPITSVSSQCGYKEYSTFFRAFHRMYHCAPSSLIKSGNK